MMSTLLPRKECTHRTNCIKVFSPSPDTNKFMIYIRIFAPRQTWECHLSHYRRKRETTRWVFFYYHSKTTTQQWLKDTTFHIGGLYIPPDSIEKVSTSIVEFSNIVYIGSHTLFRSQWLVTLQSLKMSTTELLWSTSFRDHVLARHSWVKWRNKA